MNTTVIHPDSSRPPLSADPPCRCLWVKERQESCEHLLTERMTVVTYLPPGRQPSVNARLCRSAQHPSSRSEERVECYLGRGRSERIRKVQEIPGEHASLLMECRSLSHKSESGERELSGYDFTLKAHPILILFLATGYALRKSRRRQSAQFGPTIARCSSLSVPR